MAPTQRTFELIGLLRKAADDPGALGDHIDRFQSVVFHASDEELGGSERSRQILRTLAHDLDFFVPNPDWVLDDASYFAEDRAVDVIRNALALLHDLEA